MDKPTPNLDDLKGRFFLSYKDGGTFDPKCRKTVEACWDEISRVALQYWEGTKKPWKEATPKKVEEEYEELAKATERMIEAMKGLSNKAMGLPWDFAKKIRKEVKSVERQEALTGNTDIRWKRSPMQNAWARCNGQAWFLDHSSREMRNEKFEGSVHDHIAPDQWSQIIDWGRLRELTHVQRLAEHFQAQAKAIKEEQASRGAGWAWGTDPWEVKPDGVLCRRIREVLVERGLKRSHARLIGYEIYMWADPDRPEADQISIHYFGVKSLRKK